MEGLVFGRYRVTHKLGQGGMAEVWAARHELMGQEAAVKVLLPEMSVHQDVVKRFFNEAQAAAHIKHPGIVDVFDVGYAPDGRAYIIMERLSGQNLNMLLEVQNTLPIDRTVLWMRQLAGVMAAAHERGIIHRDLKPENLFIVPDPDVARGERIKVLDFGLAKLAAGSVSILTAQGAIFGTPAYMAPEQCHDSGKVDARADLYAIGCIFYRCLCGQAPFGSGGVELLRAQLRSQAPRPRSLRAEIPAEIDALIMRLLAKSPDDRVQSCRELIELLGGELGASAAQGGEDERTLPFLGDRARPVLAADTDPSPATPRSPDTLYPGPGDHEPSGDTDPPVAGHDDSTFPGRAGQARVRAASEDSTMPDAGEAAGDRPPGDVTLPDIRPGSEARPHAGGHQADQAGDTGQARDTGQAHLVEAHPGEAHAAEARTLFPEPAALLGSPPPPQPRYPEARGNERRRQMTEDAPAPSPSRRLYWVAGCLLLAVIIVVIVVARGGDGGDGGDEAGAPAIDATVPGSQGSGESGNLRPDARAPGDVSQDATAPSDQGSQDAAPASASEATSATDAASEAADKDADPPGSGQAGQHGDTARPHGSGEKGASAGQTMSPAELQALVDTIKGAMRDGQYGAANKACRKARQALRKDETELTLCGMAACRVRDAASARRILSMLPEHRQSAVRQSCLLMDITLETSK